MPRGYAAKVREPLRHRQFLLLFLAQCASFLGDAIFLVAIAFAVLEVAGTGAAIATVLASGSFLLVLSFLFSGVWADRLPRVGLMVASDVVRMVTQGCLAALLITETATISLMVVLYGIYSIATAFFQPARTGLTPQLLQPGLLVPANGLLSMAQQGVSILGWAGGGLLVAWLGAGGAIAVDAATFAVSAGLLLAIGHVPSAADRSEREPFLHELATGWREMVAHRWLWYMVAGATLWLLVLEAPLQVVGPLTMERAYDGAVSWGLLGTGLASGAIVGAFVASRGLMRRPMRNSLVCFFASGVMPILLAVEAPFAALVACNVVVGLSFGLFDTIWNSAMQARVPADKLARVSAWDWMGSLAGVPVGYALAGVTVEAFGREPTLYGMAIATFCVCTALIIEPEVRDIDAPTHH